MKKNYDRKSKLSSYSAMAGSLLAIAGSADAQIKYTNVNPDSVLTNGESMVIDLDTNGTPEFVITMSQMTSSSSSSSTAYAALITVLNNPNNAVTGSLYSGAYPLPYAKNLGDTIKASLPWNNQTLNGGVQYLGIKVSSAQLGNFLNTNSKFIGVRFMANTNTYYGWIRVSLNAACTQLTVLDYAYQSNGAHIICGQTNSLGVEENDLSSFVNIHSFEKTVYLDVDKSIQLNGEVQITNLLGENVHTCSLEANTQKIDLSTLNTGIYFVTLHHEKGDVVKKIYIY